MLGAEELPPSLAAEGRAECVQFVLSRWCDERRELWSDAFALVESGEADLELTLILGLVLDGKSIRDIARAIGRSKSAVHEQLLNARAHASRRKREQERQKQRVEILKGLLKQS